MQRSQRIGTGYGLSGSAVYRVEADTSLSGSLSFIAKQEGAEAVERALLFHRSSGTALRGSIPECFGGIVDREAGLSVLFLEDISPARQGDVLSSCTDLEAEAAMRSLARVHAASWTDGRDGGPTGAPRWSARPIDPDVWAERLARVASEFPHIVTPRLAKQLSRLPVEAAIESLGAGPASWIHCDAHLDNVLFRPDATAVLIDWSGARFGPPAVDLARLLTEGVDAGANRERATKLVAAYADELDASVDDARRLLSDALVLQLQAAVGWAGREERREPQARMNALRQNLLRSCCAWGNECLTRL